ncbi:MAG: GNAT family N-acetyltransferase, partial [bacterium]|nr:GNAT family N-acetyltransferase [bacterium]
LAATATAVCFERDLAWIGMVLTDPGFRRRGFARQLVERALAFLDERRVRWIKLDATDMGAPLYRDLGFADECGIERWQAVAPPCGRPDGLDDFRNDRSLDIAAFGADRGMILDNLARGEAVSLAGEGYAMGRPGVSAASFGPCVARSAESARALLEWFLAAHTGQRVFWDILPDNREAVGLAKEFGFEPVRKLIRMVRPGVDPGKPFARDNSLVYATAGFEYG